MFKNFRKRWAKEPEFKATAVDKPEPNPNCEVLRALRFKNNLYVVGDKVQVMYYISNDGPTRELDVVEGRLDYICETRYSYPSHIGLDISTRFHSKTRDINVDDIDMIALLEDEDAEAR